MADHLKLKKGCFNKEITLVYSFEQIRFHCDRLKKALFSFVLFLLKNTILSGKMQIPALEKLSHCIF